MSSGVLKYGGTHVTGFDPNGRPVIRLFPFNQTRNHGGVYILAVCKGTRGPSDCKYDAFRCAFHTETPPPAGGGGEQPPKGEQPPGAAAG